MYSITVGPIQHVSLSLTPCPSSAEFLRVTDRRCNRHRFRSFSPIKCCQVLSSVSTILTKELYRYFYSPETPNTPKTTSRGRTAYSSYIPDIEICILVPCSIVASYETEIMSHLWKEGTGAVCGNVYLIYRKDKRPSLCADMPQLLYVGHVSAKPLSNKRPTSTPRKQGPSHHASNIRKMISWKL